MKMTKQQKIQDSSRKNVPFSSTVASKNKNISKVPTENKKIFLRPNSNTCVNESHTQKIKCMDIQMISNIDDITSSLKT